MPSPLLTTATSTPRRDRRLIHWVYWLVGSTVLVEGGLVHVRAQSAQAPTSAANALDAVLARPLTRETWPDWRETYIRIFYEDDLNPEKEDRFYEQTRVFFRLAAGVAGDSLPQELAHDPMAWVATARTFMHLAAEGLSHSSKERLLDRAEEASRKGVALGDPRAIASYTLAETLVRRGLSRDTNQPLTTDLEQGLSEAEERLRHVEQVSPRANVDLWRGLIAKLRGDKQKVAALLGKAVDDHPKNATVAVAFLMNTMDAGDVPGKLAERTGPFATRFPNNAEIQALHAAALFRDERYTEAADTLRHARQLDEKVTQFLGEEGVKAIEESRQLTPQVMSGLKAMKAGMYETACAAFRQALVQDPKSPLVARLLARELVDQLVSEQKRSAELATSAAREIRALSQLFPKDAEIQASLAAALHLGGRNIEAAQALDRAKRLGAVPEKLFDSASLLAIRRDAESDEGTRFWKTIAIAAVIGAVLWIGIMFAMGAILAVSIPRVPRLMSLTGEARSRREIWLERFYLLVLSLGLLIFYASVPVVAAGLLAVTLVLFGVLLAIRILHFGILQRGLWAFWNVLRCTLIGPQDEVLGIEATGTEQPLLFESLNVVADRIKTRPVDKVYLTPSSNIAVKQQGSGPFGLLGKRRRILEIGISTLPLLSREEFHSILAHEYGHFSRNDTLYSRFIFQVSASLATSLAVMSAAGGFLNYINPFYWFWWLYLRAYTLLANGFSRSREFLADRQAVAAYGKQSFISGLTKVAVDGALFESTVYANIQHLLSQGKAFTNAFDAFRHFRDQTEMVESRERMLDRLRSTKPKWLDTHPTFSERLAAIADFPDSAPAGESRPAIELLSDHQAVEAKLTGLLTSFIHERLSAMNGLRSNFVTVID
jgi:Zn-dependent protease with chaperone function/tetratricopeptide (TPR) repeat protein